jgi:hypothetical protein
MDLTITLTGQGLPARIIRPLLARGMVADNRLPGLTLTMDNRLPGLILIMDNHPPGLILIMGNRLPGLTLIMDNTRHRQPIPTMGRHIQRIRRTRWRRRPQRPGHMTRRSLARAPRAIRQRHHTLRPLARPMALRPAALVTRQLAIRALTHRPASQLWAHRAGSRQRQHHRKSSILVLYSSR